MKLQLKHLASYLPYGLRAYFKEVNDRYCRKYVIGTIHAVYDDVSIICYDTVNSNPDKFKLILRPLSDLTKEIEVNGEKFVPTDKIAIHLFDLDTRKIILNGEANGIPFWVIQKLLEWHFDIYRLIQAKLAIDINTLNK